MAERHDFVSTVPNRKLDRCRTCGYGPTNWRHPQPMVTWACCDWDLIAHPSHAADRFTSARTCDEHVVDGKIPDPDAVCNVCEQWRMTHPQGCQRPEPVKLYRVDPLVHRLV